MFSFVKNFLTRGHAALFSYLSWQVQLAASNRFFTLMFNVIVTLLLISVIL